MLARLLNMTATQLVASVVAAVIVARLIRHYRLAATLPPFLPLYEMDLPTLLTFPIFGHALLLTKRKRLNALIDKHGAAGWRRGRGGEGEREGRERRGTTREQGGLHPPKIGP